MLVNLMDTKQSNNSTLHDRISEFEKLLFISHLYV